MLVVLDQGSFAQVSQLFGVQIEVAQPSAKTPVPSGTPRADRALVRALRVGLRAEANPARAATMQTYMKSATPYYGVLRPNQKRIFRTVFDTHPLYEFEEWRDTILEIWRNATFREERYGAIALMGQRRYRTHLVRDALPILEEFIVTGAWWDYVDSAAQLVGEILCTDRRWMSRELRQWSRDSNMWKRRAAMLGQLRFKADTDLTLLCACIEPNLDDREFFIRKAIGWALRQYAWIDPEWVMTYVRTHSLQLSPLSKREALRNLCSDGTRRA